MPTAVMCPSCELQIRVRDELVGERVKCPGCGEGFTADEAFDYVSPETARRELARPSPKPTLKEKLLEGSATMFAGLGMMVVGGVLMMIVPALLPIGLFSTGFCVFLYGLAGGSVSSRD